jgi:ribonuclease P protein component
LPASGSRLPRRLSLKQRREIEALFAAGRRIQLEDISIRWQPQECFRYGVFLRGRGSTAVARNRLKRILREAIRLNRKALNNPVHLAVLFARKAKDTDFHALDTQIKVAFDRINAAFPSTGK